MFDTGRYNMLKNVFKKAAGSILNKDELETVEKIKDSFYSETEKTKEESKEGDSETTEIIEKKVEKKEVEEDYESLDQFIEELKSKFAHTFKEKVAEYNLEHLLNNLDYEVKSRRHCTRDMRDKKYIKEILESHVVDSKENIAMLMEEETRALQDQMKQVDERIEEINKKMRELENENELLEKEYKEVINKHIS